MVSCSSGVRSAVPHGSIEPTPPGVVFHYEGGGRVTTPVYVRSFQEIGAGDVPLVGGKTASIGEMYCELSADGVRVPNGFAITADAYRLVLDRADAWGALHGALDGLATSDVAGLTVAARRARH